MTTAISLSKRIILLGMITLLVGSFFITTVSAQTTNLGDILVRFCNDAEKEAQGGTKSLLFEAQAGQPEEICILLSNTGEDDVNVKLNFVDGTITNDGDGKKACGTEGQKEKFGKYVSLEDNVILAEKGKTVKTFASATFPAGFAGINYGCITSQIVNLDESGAPKMFEIEARRANFIDAIVKGNVRLGISLLKQQNDGIRSNLGKNDMIMLYFDNLEQKYFAQLTIQNTGNVPELITFNGTVSDIMKKEIALDTQERTVLPGQDITFKFDITNTIPWYKGPITIATDISHVPVFEFESDSITDEMRQKKSFSESTSLMLYPWILLGGVVALLLAIILLLGSGGDKKDKKTVAAKKKTTTRKAPVKRATKKKAPAKKKTTTRKTTTKKTASK